MVLVEKVGNIKAYAEKNAERDYTITLINDTDIIATGKESLTNRRN